ncbi:MAG: hypothetical protein GX224_03300 [Thermoplasmatales archaeon]|nr:hypothetical protein [Thermoplasmatales archaeon]
MELTEMDGFIGSAVAAESVLDSTTILHGPGGCRIHLTRLSSRYLKREFNVREGDHFFRFDRVPCTYIDHDDYVYGAVKKIPLVLKVLGREETRFATVIQSPGAALIGDRLKDKIVTEGLGDRTLVLDESFMSEKFSVGFDSTLTEMTRKLTRTGCEKRPRTANIIGLPFTCRGYFRLLEELKSKLSVMGIRVVAAVGAGCTIDELKESAGAEYNICIHPEYCKRLSEYYNTELGIPTVFNEMGAPFGPYSMKSFIDGISKAFDTDPSPLTKEIDESMEDLKMITRSSLDVGERLRYKTFSIRGESSVVYPVSDFMIRYLKMVPKSIVLTEKDEGAESRIRAMLEKINESEALETEFASTYTNVLFGPGSYVKLLESQGMCGVGIDISLPSQDMIDFAPKSILGMEGFRIVIDKLLNSR